MRAIRTLIGAALVGIALALLNHDAHHAVALLNG